MTKKNLMKRSAFVLAGLLCTSIVLSDAQTVLADELDPADAQVVTDDAVADSVPICTYGELYQQQLDQAAAEAQAAEEAAIAAAMEQLLAEATTVQVNQTRAFKSYESYRALTKKSSTQKALQDQAETDVNGFRVLNGRYLVATGHGFGMSVGQNFDLVLANGTVIPCTVGDLKRNRDTDSSNIFSASGCCSEFIVDPSMLPASVKYYGNCSKVCSEWDSVVTSVIIYNAYAI